MSTHTLALGGRDLALELYQLLRDLDSARFRADVVRAAEVRMEALEQGLTALLDEYEGATSTLRERLEETLSLIRQHREDTSQADQGSMDELTAREQKRATAQALKQDLHAAYERLAASLRERDVHVPSLRPTNYARNLLHMSVATLVMCLVVFLFTTDALVLAAATAMTCIAWTAEGTRRIWPRVNDWMMALFGPTSHPHERHRVNSATWYVTALLVLALTQSTPAILAAVAVLGFGDPVAAVVGRRFGRIRTLNGRTLEGSLAFAVVGFVASALVLTAFQELSAPQMVLVSASAAVSGAVAETLARRVDDNFAVPVVAGLCAYAVVLLG